jgi:hypothetical protein
MLKGPVVRITREELYQRVWEQPLRTLAQEFGISDVALAKTCRKAKIPVPGRGFWAQRAAGKQVRMLSLPTLRDSDLETLRTIEFWPRPKPEAPSGPIAEQAAFESQREHRIEVSDALRKPHPLVKATLEALESGTRLHNGYLGNWQVRHLDVEVTQSMLKCALRILDAVVKAFEARSWEVSLGKGDDRKSYVTIFGQRVSFGIREPWRQAPIPPAERRTYGPPYREEPSGRLALVIRESWGHSIKKSITETATRPLEGRLNDFMVTAVAIAHERAEWERRRAESEERQRKVELAQKEARRRQEAEATRVKSLEEESERWLRSRTIREYAGAVRAAAEMQAMPTESGELAAWLQWAESHARSLDPVERRVRELTSALVAPSAIHPPRPPPGS